jgi:hypothetical protein
MEDFKGRAALLSARGFDAVNGRLETDACVLWSLLAVETRGVGFLPNRRPKILFERHKFHDRTGGRFDAVAPDISSSRPGGYARSEADEYDRLGRAMQLDRQAALESASWGLGQIMGFNAMALGYASTDDMIARFCDAEDAQLDGVMRFIRNDDGLHAALKQQDWARVALKYNGPNYKANDYDFKLARNFQTYKTSGAPDIGIRAAQARLAYLKFNTGAVDGIVGRQTRDALRAFQTGHGIPATARLDDRTAEELAQAAGF